MSADRGHPLEIGILVPADGAPGLARVAEAAGLDLVAVSDTDGVPGTRPSLARADADGAPPSPDADGGPPSPDDTAGTGTGLDAWTAATVAAGVTSRIGIAAVDLSVTNPVLLARAAASLDLLSGGRLRVGLADEPGVDEVIPILHTVWRERRVRSTGPHHPVPGAQGGPVPAHDLAVWTRRDVADTDAVWAPTTTEPGGAPAPAHEPDVRRIVTLEAPSSADQLTSLVVDDGVSIVLVRAGSPEEVRALGAASSDARGRIARTRSERRTAPAPSRPARVRALRRPGIDYDGVPVDAVEPGDVRYPSMRSTYLRGGRPGIVLLPQDASEVATALTWARDQDVDLAIRSGGHGISGRSTNDGGVVLDLRRLSGVEVVGDRRVRVGPGARWGEVARSLAPHGWALTSGDYGGVGVGGLATAGGIGFLGRQQGLTIDHLRGAEVVLADGTVVRAGPDENPDLFWGVRGAGSALGVVTSFEFEVPEVGEVGFAQLVFAAPDLAAFLEGFGEITTSSPRDLTPFLIAGQSDGVPVVQVMAMVAADDPDVVLDRLQPFARLAPLVQQQVTLGRYADVVRPMPSAHRGAGEPVTRSGLVTDLSGDVALEAAELVASGATPFFQVRSVGGAVNDVPADATAYAHRSAGFSLLAMGTDRAGLDAAWEPLHEHVVGIYSSFETDRRPERLREIFPGATLDRVRTLKRRYDPENVFRHNLHVEP